MKILYNLIRGLKAVILRSTAGKKRFQKTFEALNLLSLIGMNIGGGPNNSGEKSALKYIDNRFKSLEKVILFDVGANVGQYLTLMKEVFGEKAEMYSFEPSHKTFQKLQSNFGGKTGV